MKITIRRAVFDDLDQVIELASESIIHSISPIRATADAEAVKVTRRLDLTFLKNNFYTIPGVAIFVAETEAKEIIGHIILVTGTIDLCSLEIQSFIFDLSVKENYQRKGISTILCKKAETYSKMKGCRYIASGVTSTNERIILQQKKCGFTEERLQLIKTINEKQKEETIKAPLLTLPDITFKQLTSVSQKQLGEITELYLEEIIPASLFPLREVNLSDLKKKQNKLIQERITDSLANHNCRIITAEDKDGKIAGFSFYARSSSADITTEKQGNFLDLAVRSDYKGTGLAYLLNWKAEEDMWSVKENQYIINIITVTNKRSLAFAKKMGFLEERKYLVKKL